MAELSREQHIRREILEQLPHLLRASEEDFVCYISIPALRDLERMRAFDMLDILEHEGRITLRRLGNEDRAVALAALGKLSLEQSEEDWQSSRIPSLVLSAGDTKGISPMAVQSPKSFFPIANDVVSAYLPRRGRVLLILLKSHEGLGKVHQPIGGFNRAYFFADMEGENRYLGTPLHLPEYGADQPKVSMAFREAWAWLEKESALIHTPNQPHPDWFLITPSGEKLWSKAIRFEQWEKEGLESVKHKLLNDPLGGIGGTPEVRAWAAEWVRMKDGNSMDAPETPTPDVLFLLEEIDSLLKNRPASDGNAGIWWGRANHVIDGWDASKSENAKAAESLFMENLHSIGKGASQRHGGLQQMISLLTQARVALARKGNAVKPLDADAETPVSRRVFIVHGHDEGALHTVARFLEQMDFKPVILHEQPNQGSTVIEKFEKHSDVGFAVVLLTPDDEGRKKAAEPGHALQPRARQNVILELGYFIGCLGRDKVCAIKVGDIEIPSDILGVLWVAFDSGQWKQALANELQAAGFTVDWNKVMGAR